MRFACIALTLTVGVVAAAQSTSRTETRRLQADLLGQGGPVVLLGGGLLGADGWGGVPSLLANTHRVINAQSLAVQFGLENRALPDGYSLRTEVEALRATLDTMRVARADVIGMSHGGVTALLFALELPRRVRT